MKKLISLLLVLAMAVSLAACGAKEPAPTTAAPTQAPTVATEAPTEAPTTEPTTVPTEPQVYFNPLNGEILDEPFTGRIYANTISNIPDALPHVGVVKADILMEMFVNNSIIRCLALFSDLSDVDAIGSTRSTRLMFNDIAQHYDAILSHANGSSLVRKDFTERGIDNINLDNWEIAQTGASYRDTEYKYGEHNLFGVGPGIMAYAESQGMRMTSDPDKDYGLRFTEDGTPADGEAASQVNINITYGNAHKETVMVYNEELGKYVYNQYGKEMHDQITDEVEAFENVLVMYADISVETTRNMYHQADFLAGGEGYFACGGKIIPITWTCDAEDEPFRFFTQSGDPLYLGQGNTYIAIAHPDSEVTWQ
ncbi:MAG: DUF3048 domain-containing protein [Eubacteriales bacterium]|nr:DUF3048 domain-containing protein [Eubacteriales bacterium]